MEPKKQLHAFITSGSWDMSRTPVPVDDDFDAAQKTLAARGICFNTCEITTVELDGQTLKGKPENYSARRYVGIDRLFTRDEVIQSMEADMNGAYASMRDAIRSVIEHYREKPADSIHITGLERHGEFIGIGKDEKVFDRKGQQIWPLVAPDMTTEKTFKPMKPLHLRPKGP
jgi:hypothetical protein